MRWCSRLIEGNVAGLLLLDQQHRVVALLDQVLRVHLGQLLELVLVFVDFANDMPMLDHWVPFLLAN